MMQCGDLIPVTVLLGCSEANLLLNGLVGGCGPGRQGMGSHVTHPWASPALTLGPGSWRAPVTEMETLVLLCCRSPLL